MFCNASIEISHKDCSEKLIENLIQSPLDIETLDKAAALDLATSRAVTDLRQYINTNLGFGDLKICFL